jgi:hypothetical protein
VRLDHAFTAQATSGYCSGPLRYTALEDMTSQRMHPRCAQLLRTGVAVEKLFLGKFNSEIRS